MSDGASNIAGLATRTFDMVNDATSQVLGDGRLQRWHDCLQLSKRQHRSDGGGRYFVQLPHKVFGISTSVL